MSLLGEALAIPNHTAAHARCASASPHWRFLLNSRKFNRAKLHLDALIQLTNGTLFLIQDCCSCWPSKKSMSVPQTVRMEPGVLVAGSRHQMVL
ncbi:hypothetical protein LDENG_00044630 [Lucifuga dentata]|nr:hypothetical protein LDENG_00044630 [Lucifuga dentata]